jgi:MFS family permease
MGLATTWQGVLGGRFLDRLGAGTRTAPRDALIASSVDDKDRGKAFGLEGIGDNAGAFLGPLIAVVLLIALHIDIRWVFYLAIIPGLLAVLMILLVKERPAPVTAKSRIDLSLRQFPKPYWRYLLATALFGIGNSSNSFLILQTKDLGASLEATILIYAAFNLVAALISYPAGFLSDRWGRRNILLLSFLIFFVAYLGFALTRNVAPIAVLWIVSRDISLRRQGASNGFRSRTPSGQWGRLVQHDGGTVGIGGKRRCRTALGPCWPCSRVFLRCGICRSG